MLNHVCFCEKYIDYTRLLLMELHVQPTGFDPYRHGVLKKSRNKKLLLVIFDLIALLLEGNTFKNYNYEKL